MAVDKAGALLGLFGSENAQLTNNDKLFYSQVDKETGKVIGYRMTSSSSSMRMWVVNLNLQPGDEIHMVRSQRQTASDIEHQYFLPTAFVGDNLLYKYLDSNMFVVSTIRRDLGKMSVYVINGVSGNVVYKFSENNVDTEQAVDIAVSEHFVVLALQRLQFSHKVQANSRQELSVVELY